MSDDTPTEPYDPASGDAPTRKLPQQPAADAPTERIGAPVDSSALRTPSSDAPTEFIPSQDAAPTVDPVRPPYRPPALATPAAAAAPPANPAKKSRGPLIAFIILGVLLIAAIVVLAFALNGGVAPSVPVASPPVSPSPTPSASPAPSPTPSATPSPTPTPEPSITTVPQPTEEPAPTGAVFTSFSPGDGETVGCRDEKDTVPLVFSWSSTGAQLAWFGTGTTNAKGSPDAEVDTTDTYRDARFDCGKEDETYTVTLDDGTGKLTSQTVILVRTLEGR